MPRSVALFRNLNLGQGWSPTRAQLVSAFEDAGATDVLSHQVNGTVAFSATAPVRTARTVADLLRERTGFDDLVVVRSARWVLDLARRIETLGLDPEDSTEVVLYDLRPPLPFAVPWHDGPLTIVVADRRHAITAFRPVDGRGSNAGAVLQRLTGVRGTARGTGTMLRLAARL